MVNGKIAPPSRAGKTDARSQGRQQRGAAESFAQIVGVLMRDQNFRTLALGELDWMVIPPVLANQFALAHAAAPQTAVPGTKADKGQTSARVGPVAVARWARVSSSSASCLPNK